MAKVGRPKGTTRANGYKVSGGRPKGSKNITRKTKGWLFSGYKLPKAWGKWL